MILTYDKLCELGFPLSVYGCCGLCLNWAQKCLVFFRRMDCVSIPGMDDGLIWGLSAV